LFEGSTAARPSDIGSIKMISMELSRSDNGWGQPKNRQNNLP
jgi:hypothetical protein